MDEKSYSEFVASRVKNPEDLIREMTPHKAHADHMGIGVSTEAGEILDCIKKYTKYNKPIDLANLIEELGDIEFYLEGVRQAFGVKRDDTLNGNYLKLSKRYSEKFSNEQAQARADKASDAILSNAVEIGDFLFFLLEGEPGTYLGKVKAITLRGKEFPVEFEVEINPRESVFITLASVVDHRKSDQILTVNLAKEAK